MHNIIWKQEKVTRDNINYNKIYFDYENTEIYFLMPEDYNLDSTRVDLLHLAEILLLSPFEGYTDLIDKYKNTFTRSFGSKNSLSFSTGVDSTVAMLLLPKDTLLSYYRRDFESMLIHDNAVRFINHLKTSENKDVIVVPSNHEIIRTFNGLTAGFSTDITCLVHLVLLADYLDLKSISTGMVLEGAYLKGGSSFKNFNNSDFYFMFKELFESCGLYLHYPTVGLSEIITNEIIEKSIYKDYAQSCLRKIGGCDSCYKCYRKGLLKGKILPISRETSIFTSHRPPKVLSAIVYGAQKNNVEIEGLKDYMHLDFNFLEKYYPKYLDLNDSDDSNIKKYIKKTLKEYNIKPMTDSDITKLENLKINK